MSHGAYSKGLHEVGEGLYAYLQPDGGWGWSNAGLIADGEASLLVDTLFDLALTREMLAAMRDAVPAAASIGTLVNTHANGDHCFGNQLLGDARIVASERTAEQMGELPPAAMQALVAQAPQMGALGEFFLDCFGAFDFDGIELRLPDERFEGTLTLQVGDLALQLLEVGPAHTRGDTLVFVAERGALFSGDILFNGAHPIVWAGPASNWIAACDRIIALAPSVIVPGHGPLADLPAVHETKAYFEYLYEHCRRLRERELTPLQAAASIELDRWAQWGERERLAVNVANIFRELDGEEPLDGLAAFQLMAETRLQAT